MAAQPLPERSDLPSPRVGAPSGARRRRGGDRAVESMASRVARPCQRNDCPAPARAGVELSSVDKVAVLVDLVAVRDPRRMELCAVHAGTVTVPRGWSLVDERADDEPATAPVGPPTVAELGARSTLEVLSAALEADPSGDGESVHDVSTDGQEDADGPSVAAVMAAVLARPIGDQDADDATAGPDDDVAGDEAEHAQADAVDGDVDEDAVEGGTQLALAAVRPVRRPRPVPAARD